MRYGLTDTEEPYTPDRGNPFKVTGLFEMQRLFGDRACRGWEWRAVLPDSVARTISCSSTLIDPGAADLAVQ